MLEVIFGENNEENKEEKKEESITEEMTDEKGYEKTDEATLKFRKILKEKQEQNRVRKRVVMSYGKCACAALLIFCCGVGAANRLPAEKQSGKQAAKEQKVMSDEIVVENLTGNLGEPTEEIAQISIAEEVFSDQSDQIEETVEEQIEEIPEEADTEPENYIIQPGDTLVSISREKYGTEQRVEEICELNQIADGDYIREGEIILLP